jgi:hypothetical protein
MAMVQTQPKVGDTLYEVLWNGKLVEHAIKGAKGEKSFTVAAKRMGGPGSNIWRGPRRIERSVLDTPNWTFDRVTAIARAVEVNKELIATATAQLKELED